MWERKNERRKSVREEERKEKKFKERRIWKCEMRKKKEKWI